MSGPSRSLSRQAFDAVLCLAFDAYVIFTTTDNGGCTEEVAPGEATPASAVQSALIPLSLGKTSPGGAGDTKGQMRLAHVTGEGDYRLPLSVMRGQR